MFASFAGGNFSRVMDAHQADAFFHEGVELVQVCHERMAVSAVGEYDDAVGIVEEVRILRQSLSRRPREPAARSR